MDEQGLTVESESSVSIPRIAFQLIEEHQRLLQSTIDPLATSPNYAIEIYQQTVPFYMP